MTLKPRLKDLREGKHKGKGKRLWRVHLTCIIKVFWLLFSWGKGERIGDDWNILVGKQGISMVERLVICFTNNNSVWLKEQGER